MLTLPTKVRCRERGIVLPITLIVLVVMTLAGTAVIRSTDTSGLIAANLAFRNAAIHSGDIGIEEAVQWLETNKGSLLFSHSPADGYSAQSQNPLTLADDSNDPQSWPEFWTEVIEPTARIRTLPTDAAGNSVTYAIQRLCNLEGEPGSTAIACATPPVDTSSGSGKGTGVIPYRASTQVYYRITCRIIGPKNTLAYVQAIVVI